MRARWQRDLPFEELLFDRWERANALGFGEGSSIYHNSYVYGDVRVGKLTWIGPFTILEGSGGGIVIGDYCSISTGVQIYTHDSVKWAVSGGRIEYEKAPTHIGNCVYIGPLSVISKGVKIGDHCIIGAYSYVDRDIPDFSIVRGQPAKIVGKVRLGENGELEYDYFSS